MPINPTADYPAALPTVETDKVNGTLTAPPGADPAATDDHADHHNQLAAEIKALAAELGTNAKGTAASVRERILAVETVAGTPGPTGPAGPQGPAGIPGVERLLLGNVAVGDALATADQYGAPMMEVDFNTLTAALTLWTPSSGDLLADLVYSTDNKATWTSILDANKIKIPGGLYGKVAGAPVVGTIPANAFVEMQIVKALTDAGASTVLTAIGANAGTGGVTSLNIPIPVDAVTDSELLCFATSTQPTITWPAGWVDYMNGPSLTPQIGIPYETNPTNLMYLYVGRHTYTAGEATVAVTQTSAPIALMTVGVTNGTIDMARSAHLDDPTSGTSKATPGVTTNVASSILYHLGCLRTNAVGVQPTGFAFTGGVAVDASTATNRSGSANLGLAVGHETFVGPGANTARTLSWTNSCYRIMATIVIAPGRTAPRGGQLVLRLRPVS